MHETPAPLDPTPNETAGEEKLNILLVDDRPENLVALESVLEDLNQNLVKAESGREALRRLLEDEYAVILLDVQMPGMDGFETASLIRARAKNQHTPIVFLTAINKSDTHVTRGYSVGAVDYVFKPFDPEVLRAKVAAFVELARKTGELRREIEQRKQAEDEVRKLSRDLERRVRERTAELAETNSNLENEIHVRRLAEEEEKRARAAAEAAQQDLAFLGEASAILAGSLDYQTTLERVAELTVPRLADLCIVDLVETDGTVRRVATAHRDASLRPLMRELEEHYAPVPDSPQPAARVLREARSELTPEVTEDWLREGARDKSHLKVWLKLHPTSYMVVPLVARGYTLGAISLGLTHHERRYNQEDLALAEDLARRAAAAIDNARLFREVQEAGRAKDEFLAMLAHELRNPLAAISSAIFAINQTKAPDERVAHFRAVVERQAMHLSRLVDDLLDVSRITQGKIELRRQPVDLIHVVQQALDATKPLIDARDHELTVELPDHPVWLHADPTRIEQVLSNLLNNAAKYTEPGGKILLRAEEREGTAWVRVRDSGVGISSELLPRVFELFTQSDRTLDRSQGGLGIGLALVRSLILLHGGDVFVTSSGPGQGSEFSFRLPVMENPPSEAVLGQVSGQRGEPPRGLRRVLVIEDNRDAAETLSDILETWGYDVRLAHDGEKGLAVASEFGPGAVLLDIGLPGMDGYEVARRLREGPCPSGLLVALTGYGHEEDRRKSREAGFDLHLTKPVAPAELRRILSASPERVTS